MESRLATGQKHRHLTVEEGLFGLHLPCDAGDLRGLRCRHGEVMRPGANSRGPARSHRRVLEDSHGWRHRAAMAAVRKWKGTYREYSSTPTRPAATCLPVHQPRPAPYPSSRSWALSSGKDGLHWFPRPTRPELIKPRRGL